MKSLQDLNESKKQTVYVVVEDGDMGQYILDDTKVFASKDDAEKYGKKQMGSGYWVLEFDVN